MQALHCKNCGQYRIFKRTIGIGTLVLVLVTAGWGLLAIPFYKKRCIYCGMELGR